MYHEYTQEQLRSYCRSCIESLEIWARRLVHEKVVEKYGEKYIEKTLPDGNFLIKKEIRDHISTMQAKDPSRFSRPVDTLFIDQIIYFLCKREWYDSLFKEALDYAYPQGCDEAREFLNRLVPIRNSLSHSNPISIRQVEQAICYSHDFVDGLKEYYKAKGQEQVWNVPRIIRITDSFGNVFENQHDGRYGGSSFNVIQPLRIGETYSIQIIPDSSFDESEYNLKWEIAGKYRKEFDNAKKITYTFCLEDVSESLMIKCIITSNKVWHKYRTDDGEVCIYVTVLPPV